MSAVASSPPPARFFNDPKNSVYLLPVDTEEGRRLNAQYAALQHSVACKVVLAPVSLKDGDRVLDCATGTGNWMLELSQLLPPQVYITCVDVSPHLFPKDAPQNVAFEQHSVLALPAEWSGRFDLVHQRLLVFALRTEEWLPNMMELFRVTKPGGWVQMCDCDWLGMVPADEAPHSQRLREFQFKLAESRGIDMSCARRLEERFKQAGFHNVDTVMSRVPMGKLAGEGPHNATYPFHSYFTGALKDHALANGFIDSAEAYDKETTGLLEEWNTTPDANVPFFWVWGQRPT